MYNLSLYGVTIIIWGSTWIITKYQVEESSALLAVMFRYILAAVILQLTVNLFRSKEYHSRKTHLIFFLLGSSLFCWNYVFFYNAAGSGLKTGLIAVIFSTIISMNILNNAIFFKEYPRLSTVTGALIGLIGISLVFSEDIMEFIETGLFGSIIFCLLGTYLASIGNMLSKFLQQKDVSVVSANNWGMTYGALTLIIVTIFYEQKIYIPTSYSFLSGLIFLSVFGSVIGFWTYLTLLGRVGADRAAYAMIVFPIWALILSWIFEGFEWTPVKIIGVMIIIMGNLFMLKKSNLNFKPKNYG